MSAILANLLSKIQSVHGLNEALKTAEKAEVFGLKQKAKQIFNVCYDDYNRSQEVVNSSMPLSNKHGELQIMLLEAAFYTENYAICRSLVEKYFQMNPQMDQYFIRAKLILALLISYEDRSKNGNELLKCSKVAISETMAALDVALNPKNLSRYKFLIFNISVVFWKIVHKFLRTSRAKSFTAEIARVVSALEGQDDSDKEWRIMYLSAAAVCFDDEKQTKPASDYVDKAIEHSEGLLAKTLKVEDSALVELKRAQEEVDKIMSAFRSIEEREELMHKPKKIDPDLEDDQKEVAPVVYPPLEGLAAEGYDAVKKLLDIAQKGKAASESKFRHSNERKVDQMESLNRLYMQRVFVNPSDAKRFITTPNLTKYVRTTVLVTLQCMLTPNCITDKEWEPTFTQLVAKLEAAGPPAITANQRCETFLDICRTAWYLKQRKVALRCYEIAAASNSVSPLLRTKMDVCEAIHMLADLTDLNPNEVLKQRLSRKQTDGYQANRRIDAIKLLERALSVCVTRLNDSMLSQEIGVIIWNASVPLLQGHLRLKAYSALKSVSTCLDAVSSPLVQLRSQLHFELTKCEEQSDFVAIAKDEGLLALHGDYGGLEHPVAPTIAPDGAPIPLENQQMNRNRPMDLIIGPMVELLELRCNVFDSPADVEGKVMMWLQQAKESKSKEFITDLLNKCAFVMLRHLKLDDDDKNNLTATDVALGESSSKTKRSTRAIDLDDISNLDIAISTMRRDELRIGEAPLEHLETILSTPRSGVQFKVLNPMLHKQLVIMTQMAQMAHTVQNVNVLQQAACFVLSFVWDPQDKFLVTLIDAQIQLHNLLADSLVHRICAQAQPSPTKSVSSLAAASVNSENKLDQQIDHRSLGIKSDQCPADIAVMKRLIILSLEKGVTLAVSAKDILGVQNAVVYLWNLHLHIFRNDLFTNVMDELMELVKLSITTIDSLKATINATPSADALAVAAAVDDRMRLAMIESLAGYLECKHQLHQAIEIAVKGSTGHGTEYMRKRICEMVSRLLVLQHTAGAAAAGDKKGGKPPPPVEPPKYDNPFLTLFASITHAEQPIEMVPKETSLSLIDKAVALMTGDVATYLSSIKWDQLTQERYSQLIEMQTEGWCRIIRLRLLFDDTVGAQFAAEKCLSLVSKESMSREDESMLNSRVLRWMSVCERLFGMTVASMIKPEGQEVSLQNELRLISLQHLTVSCEYGLRAEVEDLVLEAATVAWNVSMDLIDATDLRDRLFAFQRRIMNTLLKCSTPLPVPRNACMLLRQQFYLATIEGFANIFDWTNALKMVMEAFDNVAVDFQKPLWQWRVIAMSKKGKSVLDGLQKLKENDPKLQAQVYAILARSSSDIRQQLEAYMKAVEILDGNMERIEYMLECSQFMATSGLPRPDIRMLLLSTLDGLLEVEEKDSTTYPGLVDMDDDEVEDAILKIDGDTFTVQDGGGDGRSVGPKTRGSTTSGNAKSEVSRKSGKAASATSKTSRRSMGTSGKDREKEKLEAEKELLESSRLNLKQLEQTVRTLTMLTLLETKNEERLQRCVQAVFFLNKSVKLWFQTLQELDCAIKFETAHAAAGSSSASVASKGQPVTIAPTLEEFQAIYHPPHELLLPEEPLSLLFWQPTELFAQLSRKAAGRSPLTIPTSQSYPSLPLTFHYLLLLAKSLHNDFGFSKHALFILAFIRMLLIAPTSSHDIPVEAGESVLALTQLNVLSILYSLNLHSVASKISTSLSLHPHASASGDKSGHAGHAGHSADTDHNTVTIASYIKEFIKKQKVSPELKPSEPLPDRINQFGFSTWTPNVNSSIIDARMQLLEISEKLLDMGQMQVAQVVGRTLLIEFDKCGASFASIRCRSVLAKIAYIEGHFPTAAATALSCRDEIMAVAGDPIQLGEQTAVLVRSYCSMGKVEAAKQAAESAISLLLDFCIIAVDKSRIVAANTASSPTRKMTSNVNSTVTLLTVPSTTQAPAVPQKFECSRENAFALVEITFAFVDTLLWEINRSLPADGVIDTSHFDPRGNYLVLCDKLSRVHDVVCDICGTVSELSAKVLAKRASAGAAALLKMHTLSGSCVTLPHHPDAYKAWFEDNLRMCIEYMEKVVQIRKTLLSFVPLKETICYLDGAAQIQDSSGALLPTPYTELSLLKSRELAASQVELSQLEALVVILRAEHVSTGSSYAMLSRLNIVEQYLEKTKPLPEVLLESFHLYGSFKAAAMLSAASQNLRGTDLALDARALFQAHNCMILRKREEFDSSWNPALNPAHTDHVKDVPPVTPEAEQCRNQLEVLARELVHHGRLTNVPTCCVALMEAYGANHPSKAACWLLQLQSCATRLWMRALWLRSLPPSGQVAASVRRLDALQDEHTGGGIQWPDIAAMKQIEAEKLFLHNSSVAFRRLSVSADPVAIVQSAPYGVVFLSLQFCPLGETLYVCAGRSSRGPVAPVAAAPAKGAPPAPIPAAESASLEDKNWFFDKVRFGEERRRRLHQLQGRHKVWVADVAKFINMYGGSVATDFDLETQATSTGVNFESGSTSIQKAEKSLAERFRSNLREMEALFSEVLSSESASSSEARQDGTGEEKTGEADEGVGRRLSHFLFHNMASSLATAPAGKKSEPSLLLLLEPSLQALPWEGMSYFGTAAASTQTKPLYSLCRDFSIHLFHHRMKAISGDAPLPAYVNLPSSAMRFAVDPFDDDVGGSKATGRSSIQESFDSSLAGIVGGKKWHKLRSSSTGNLSLQDWVVSVHNNTVSLPAPAVAPTGKEAKGAIPPAQIPMTHGVFLHTFGRFGSLLSPQELVSSLDLEKVALLCVFDQAHVETSARRQVSADVIKPSAEVELEQPLNMIGLLTLAGPGAVVIHAWSTPLGSQVRLLQSFWQPFSSGTAGTACAALTQSSLMGHSRSSADNHQQQQQQQEKKMVKQWIRASRVIFGLPNITYSDA